MLIIRQQQMESLKKIPRIHFENQLIDQMREHFPREYQELGWDRARIFVQHVLSRSRLHSCSSQRCVTYYMSLMLLLGSDFDLDVQLPWVAEIFEDSSLGSSSDQLTAIWNKTIAYIGITAGEELENLIRALVRLKSFDFKAMTIPEDSDLSECLSEMLHEFYPQKWNYQGDEINRELISRATKTMQKYSITNPKGCVLFTTLMFMLGSGFHHDPLFPWAVDVLNNQDGHDQEVTIERLYEAAMQYLSFVLSKK